MELLNHYAVAVLVPAAVTLLAALGAKVLHKLAAYLHVRAEAEKSDMVRGHALAALEVLANCAADAVQVMESTERPKLKAATADGKISAEEGAQLAKDARDMAIAQAKAAAPQILEAAGLSDLEAIVGHFVEGAAARLAGDSRANLSAPPPASAPAPSATPATGSPS